MAIFRQKYPKNIVTKEFLNSKSQLVGCIDKPEVLDFVYGKRRKGYRIYVSLPPS